MPTSRKTRALLAYLAISGSRYSRQSLCDLLFDNPDDPLAALRWSLSKLRPIANADGSDRLGSDRKHIWFDHSEVDTDRDRLEMAVANAHTDESECDTLWLDTDGVLLEDCELPNQSNFTAWLEGQRNDLSRARARLARRCARDESLPVALRQKWIARWSELYPFSRDAARCSVEIERLASGESAAETLARSIAQHFKETGIEPPSFEYDQSIPADTAPIAASQRIRFVESNDGVSIAWASVGDESNPPLVKAANWLNHLELDWEAPIWSPLFRELAGAFQVIRYDERGCGLSDWDVDEISFDKFVDDLEQVVDAAGLERFPLLGISQGAAVSIEYAARHPERVSKLILFGAYDCGWRHNATPEQVREREAVMVLTETGWGSDNPVYRHMFSRTFMPDANAEELDWFDEFQRQTTSPANAVRFLEAFSSIDVRDRLAEVKCPTMVVHSRGDLRIPFATGRSIASRIRGAELAGIESNNHLLLGREAASVEFMDHVRKFALKS